MSLLDFFKKKLTVAPVTMFPGVLDDQRSKEEKAKDFESREVATAAPVTWTVKPRDQWRKFEIFNQSSSGSCVGQSVSKALSIENFLEEGRFIRLSARDIYSRRSNQGSMGMFLPNAMEIGGDKEKGHGATLEVLMPSEGRDEAGMNDKSDYSESSDQIALIFKGGGYVQFTHPLDIDEIASVIERTGKGVVICFRFEYNEWNEKPWLDPNSKQSLGHCVTAVDFTLDGGEKCLVIEDSWGQATAIQGRRLITEKFLKARCFFAGYFLDLSNSWRDQQGVTLPRPKNVGLKVDLSLGMQHDDIKVLQDILKYEELFPVNQESTGYYGNITAKGILAWQLRYLVPEVISEQEIRQLGGKTFGRLSRAKANQLYQ